MKKIILAAFLAFLTVFAWAEPITVYFSPNGGAEAAVVRELASAKSEVYVMTYQLTSKPISGALVNASMRGVKTHIVVDAGQETAKCCARDVAKNIPTLVVDHKHAIFHDKVIVVDGKTVITGSFNYSSAAEHSNAENLVVLRDPVLAQKYIANWTLHADHSEVLK